MEKAIFAAGCFWGIEEHFRQLLGVMDTCVGYIGGHTIEPTYQQVCRGDTEHAEAVEIDFEPAQISYARLLEEFWRCHNPTQKDRQGPDVGRQYRSAIFFCNEIQRQQAEASKAAMQPHFSLPIVTEIVPASTFYHAEEHHQQYVAKQRQSFWR